MKSALLCAIACVSAGAFSDRDVRADIINVPVSVQGIITNYGQNNGAFNAGSGNVLTGHQPGVDFHSYFLFDLSTLSSNITGAKFVITLPYGSLYSTGSSSETLNLFDVSSSSFSALQNQYTSGNTTVYNDLGSGTLFGSRVFTAADNLTTVSIDLNSSAIAAINAAKGGSFGIGGALASISSDYDYIFAFSGYSTNTTLQLTSAPVPEPATAMLLAAAPLLLRRRRTSRSA